MLIVFTDTLTALITELQSFWLTTQRTIFQNESLKSDLTTYIVFGL